jgi:hypothetical protein
MYVSSVLSCIPSHCHVGAGLQASEVLSSILAAAKTFERSSDGPSRSTPRGLASSRSRKYSSYTSSEEEDETEQLSQYEREVQLNRKRNSDLLESLGIKQAIR